jgi:hypothetical protein
MFKAKLIILALCFVCETVNAECSLDINSNETEDTFGDIFYVTVNDKNFDQSSDKYHRVDFEILEASEYLGPKEELTIKRLKSKNKPRQDFYRFTNRMAVQIVRKNGDSINVDNLPAGEHFVSVEFKAHCSK